MSKKKLLTSLKEIEVIHKQKVILRSGQTSDFYCDVKKSFGYPDTLNLCANEISKLLPKNTTCVVGSGYGGLPLAAVVASRNDLHLTLVRNTEKDHGKSGKIHGYIPLKKDVVVIIDDVLTSGSSIKETLAILLDRKIHVKSAVVVVARNTPELPIPYSYVLTIQDLLQ